MALKNRGFFFIILILVFISALFFYARKQKSCSSQQGSCPVIYFSNDDLLKRVNIDGSDITPVSDIPLAPGSCKRIRFSPDGRYLVFVGLLDDRQVPWETVITLVTPKKEQTIQIKPQTLVVHDTVTMQDTPVYDFNPRKQFAFYTPFFSFSPDSQYLAVMDVTPPHHGLTVIALDDGQITLTVDFPKISKHSLAELAQGFTFWSKDGGSVYLYFIGFTPASLSDTDSCQWYRFDELYRYDLSQRKLFFVKDSHHEYRNDIALDIQYKDWKGWPFFKEENNNLYPRYYLEGKGSPVKIFSWVKGRDYFYGLKNTDGYLDSLLDFVALLEKLAGHLKERPWFDWPPPYTPHVPGGISMSDIARYPSPDGNYILEDYSGRKLVLRSQKLVLRDVSTGKERVIARGWSMGSKGGYALYFHHWLPDSRYIIFKEVTLAFDGRFGFFYDAFLNVYDVKIRKKWRLPETVGDEYVFKKNRGQVTGKTGE